MNIDLSTEIKLNVIWNEFKESKLELWNGNPNLNYKMDLYPSQLNEINSKIKIQVIEFWNPNIKLKLNLSKLSTLS